MEKEESLQTEKAIIGTNEIGLTFPIALSPMEIMNSPNEIIPIYEGLFNLTFGKGVIVLKGKIWFAWSPDIRVRCQGVVIEGNYEIEDFDREFKIDIPDTFTGNLLINFASHSDVTKLSGFLNGQIIFGKPEIPVSLIHFEIPNLSYFHGEAVKAVKDDGRSVLTHSRTVFENDKYKITINGNHNHSTKTSLLRESGGFIFLYTGTIEKINGSGIVFQEYSDLRECFSHFLSFINGSTCSLTFIKGIHESKTIWSDYTPYTTNSYREVYSWLDNHSTAGLNDIWVEFSKLWKNHNDRDFLKTTLLWYTKSNSNAGHLEESIIYNQIAIELIYNWFIGEKKQLISAQERNKLHASNKVRILIKVVDTEYKLPAHFKNMRKTFKGGVSDEFELLSRIRNTITHTYDEKGIKPEQYSVEVLIEVVYFGLHIIEKSLLHILKFKSDFKQRNLTGWA